MRIREVEWPPAIKEKVAGRHGLDPDQVEAALLSRRAYLRRAGRDRYFVFAQASDGTYIIAVAAYDSGVARVISARRMTERERRTYQRRGK